MAGTLSLFERSLVFWSTNWKKYFLTSNNEIWHRQSERAESNRRRKIKLDKKHVATIKEFVKSNEGRQFSCIQVRQHLWQMHLHLNSISEITIRRWLKRELQMSYKKLETKNISSFTNEQIRSLWESAAVLLKLEESKVEQIYIDEFTVGTWRNGFYGWTKRLEKGALQIHPDSFEMSFVIALSSEKIYGMLGAIESKLAKTITFFIKKICEHRNKEGNVEKKPFVFVMDILPFHTAQSMSTILKQSSIKAVTINPYWPALNPWMKAIHAIKCFVKKDQSAGRNSSTSI